MAERTQAIERYLSMFQSRVRLHETQRILNVIRIERITTSALRGSVGNAPVLLVHRQCKRITITVVSLFFLSHAMARGRTLHRHG